MPISTTERNDILNLVVGMFGAAPGAANLALLEAQFEAGTSLKALAVHMASIDFFHDLYPSSLSDAQFVDRAFTNMTGDAIAAGPTAWAKGWALARLAEGMNRGELMLTAVQALDGLDPGNTVWADTRDAMENKAEVALHYSVDANQSSTSLDTLQEVVVDVSSDDATVATAKAEIDADAASEPEPQPEPEPETGSTFALTTVDDPFNGTANDDIFNSVYDAAVTDTLNAGDTLTGNGGMDTLNIGHFIDVAITPPDALWTGLDSIEKVVITTTGNGAQTITTSTAFEAAFAAGGVDLTTTTSGSGAIAMTLTAFTGAAILTTGTLAGAQTIFTGAGNTTVNATSTGGALHLEGEGLVGVTAITTGAGAQTILSTSTSAVTVATTTGAGALTISTGSANDTITLLSSDVAGVNIITGNAGADTITLVTGPFSAPEIIVMGGADSGLTLATADRILNFVTGVDQMKMGVAGDATITGGNYVEAGSAVADFTAGLAAANVALAGMVTDSPTFAFQFDATNGYLFNDADSDGDADQAIVLVGLTSADFAAADIIL